MFGTADVGPGRERGGITAKVKIQSPRTYRRSERSSTTPGVVKVGVPSLIFVERQVRLEGGVQKVKRVTVVVTMGCTSTLSERGGI